jgi:hypothetical protein
MVNLKKMGTYKQMHKAAYDKTYPAVTAAFKRAMKCSQIRNGHPGVDVFATTNGVNDAIEQAAKEWLSDFGIELMTAVKP